MTKTALQDALRKVIKARKATPKEGGPQVQRIGMDYALIISLALYGVCVFMALESLRAAGWWGVSVPLVVAVLFYTALKYAFINAGIQPP